MVIRFYWRINRLKDFFININIWVQLFSNISIKYTFFLYKLMCLWIVKISIKDHFSLSPSFSYIGKISWIFSYWSCDTQKSRKYNCPPKYCELISIRRKNLVFNLGYSVKVANLDMFLFFFHQGILFKLKYVFKY